MNQTCPYCIEDRDIETGNEVGFAILDAFPVSQGHTLVIPKSHVASVFELSHDDQLLLWELIQIVRNGLFKAGADAVNIGINDGQAAGQTIEHAHIHVIPRYNGDVEDPRGGVRWLIPSKAVYWE